VSLVVVAIGGNALKTDDGVGAPSEWFDALRRALPPVVDLIAAGHRVVLTHGNGPQVGEEMLRMEISKPIMPALSLDLCVAETEGSLGYAIQQVLGNLLRARGAPARVAALVTQVVVGADDPAFARPTKPIGTFYTRAQAQRMAREHGWNVVEDAGRGWRRVVASPRPVRVLEAGAIRGLVEAGFVPVAAGGGGIPVVEDADGVHGVEAVIEKDLATVVLACDLGAERVFFLTGVDRVAVGWGTPAQRFLDRLTGEEARRLLAAGEFPPGSMGPKVEAAVEFVERGGGAAVITSLDCLAEAAAGRAGTLITDARA
jgi:carbamate kinase